ncbi:hypothetical protein VUR80DRAFT_8010 [Thermomyces stellatus]
MAQTEKGKLSRGPFFFFPFLRVRHPSCDGPPSGPYFFFSSFTLFVSLFGDREPRRSFSLRLAGTGPHRADSDQDSGPIKALTQALCTWSVSPRMALLAGSLRRRASTLSQRRGLRSRAKPGWQKAVGRHAKGPVLLPLSLFLPYKSLPTSGPLIGGATARPGPVPLLT